MSKRTSFRVSVQLKGQVLKTARFSTPTDRRYDLTMQAHVVKGIRKALNLVSEIYPDDVELCHFTRSCKVLGLDIFIQT